MEFNKFLWEFYLKRVYKIITAKRFLLTSTESSIYCKEMINKSNQYIRRHRYRSNNPTKSWIHKNKSNILPIQGFLNSWWQVLFWSMPWNAKIRNIFACKVHEKNTDIIRGLEPEKTHIAFHEYKKQQKYHQQQLQKP
jgi:hypothetical protein